MFLTLSADGTVLCGVPVICTNNLNSYKTAGIFPGSLYANWCNHCVSVSGEGKRKGVRPCTAKLCCIPNSMKGYHKDHGPHSPGKDGREGGFEIS